VPLCVDVILWLAGREPRVLKVFNILAERPRTVAQWLVPRVRYSHPHPPTRLLAYLTFRRACGAYHRAASGSGRYIKFLTAVGAAWRFATFFRRKNRFFDAQGVLKHE
jgi:hypothetical protein